jgi:glycosyltransferase involved in cell wall biosynthesis
MRTEGKNLRVLYVIDEFQTTAAGTERQLLQLIQMAPELGLAPHLCTLRASVCVSESLVGCPLFQWNLRHLQSPAGIWEMIRILRWLRLAKFDVVQSFFPDANLVIPILAKLAAVPTVITTRRNQNHWMTPAYLRLQRLANRFTTRVLANSERVKEAVVRMEGLPSAKVDVIYNGVDTEHYRPCGDLRRAARAEFGLDDSHLAIGIMANLRSVKRIDLFIRAACTVASVFPNARFFVIGDGPIRGELERLRNDLELQNLLLFLGARQEPVTCLNGFDVAVLCSDSEGLSNAVLEYLACGLACVVTDVGGNREAVDGAGVVIPADDSAALAEALLRLAGDQVQRDRYAQLARKRACEMFSIDSARAALGAFYAACSR